MKKKNALTYINLLLMLVFPLVAITGILHDFIPHELYEKIHAAPGFLLFALGITHVFLNRTWIRNALFPRKD